MHTTTYSDTATMTVGACAAHTIAQGIDSLLAPAQAAAATTKPSRARRVQCECCSAAAVTIVRVTFPC